MSARVSDLGPAESGFSGLLGVGLCRVNSTINLKIEANLRIQSNCLLRAGNRDYLIADGMESTPSYGSISGDKEPSDESNCCADNAPHVAALSLCLSSLSCPTLIQLCIFRCSLWLKKSCTLISIKRRQNIQTQTL